MDQDITKVFARRLKHVRQRSGLSQAEFAERLGTEWGFPIARITILRIESQKRPVTLQEAVVMSAALGVSLSYMLTSSDPEEEIPIGNRTFQSVQVRDWLRGLLPLQDEDWSEFFYWIPRDQQIVRAYTTDAKGREVLMAKVRPPIEEEPPSAQET